jgi:hypothetical protein
MLLTGSAVALSACVGVPIVTPGGGKCVPNAGQQYIGQTASFENAQKIMDASGAATFRWGGPDRVLTTEVDPNRVTVYYDEANRVARIVCG